jgi:hypothetical protein
LYSGRGLLRPLVLEAVDLVVHHAVGLHARPEQDVDDEEHDHGADGDAQLADGPDDHAHRRLP